MDPQVAGGALPPRRCPDSDVLVATWQIATGEPGRDYRQIFFDHDVMILGPGSHGDARSNDYASGPPNSAWRQVHNFCHEPRPGDRVLMRLAKEIIGVGEIPREDEHQYSHEDAFSCVYGWDLHHTRRVRWAGGADLGAFSGVYDHAKQKPSFTAVHESAIVTAADAIPEEYFNRPLRALPEGASRFTDEELGVRLFEAGLSNRNIEEITRALKQAARLCAWYWSDQCPKARPTEHEIVSHVVLPIFLGLGWSHQQVAVEWNRIDMAFFKRTPSVEENCVMVLEAKGLGRPLSEVLWQPRSYVDKLGLTNVRKIVTTDGANLFVYGRNGGEWDTDPIGYFSVDDLKKRYVLPKKASVVDTLVMLQPASV